MGLKGAIELTDVSNDSFGREILLYLERRKKLYGASPCLLRCQICSEVFWRTAGTLLKDFSFVVQLWRCLINSKCRRNYVATNYLCMLNRKLVILEDIQRIQHFSDSASLISFKEFLSCQLCAQWWGVVIIVFKKKE